METSKILYLGRDDLLGKMCMRLSTVDNKYNLNQWHGSIAYHTGITTTQVSACI